jgi:hypothetical protein
MFHTKKGSMESTLDKVIDKIAKLDKDKAFIITSTTHEITVGRGNNGYFVIDPNSPIPNVPFTEKDDLISAIKSMLVLNSSDAKIRYKEVETPSPFAEPSTHVPDTSKSKGKPK